MHANVAGKTVELPTNVDEELLALEIQRKHIGSLKEIHC